PPVTLPPGYWPTWRRYGLGRRPDPRLAAKSADPALQAFCKPFQRSRVPMPSFSKECLGGFVGFQGVTIDPNLHFFCLLQIFIREVAAARLPPPAFLGIVRLLIRT